MKGHYLYSTWLGIRQRCNNPKFRQYKDYGGRGIKVCERWDNFCLFVEDMGPRPLGYTIERINNDGNYEPNNCKWVDRRTNNLNRRRWGISSIYRGVHLDSETGKWRAQITFKSKKYQIGRYKTQWEACDAYENKRKELFEKEPES